MKTRPYLDAPRTTTPCAVLIAWSQRKQALTFRKIVEAMLWLLGSQGAATFVYCHSAISTTFLLPSSITLKTDQEHERSAIEQNAVCRYSYTF